MQDGAVLQKELSPSCRAGSRWHHCTPVPPAANLFQPVESFLSRLEPVKLLTRLELRSWPGCKDRLCANRRRVVSCSRSIGASFLLCPSAHLDRYQWSLWRQGTCLLASTSDGCASLLRHIPKPQNLTIPTCGKRQQVALRRAANKPWTLFPGV